MGRITYRLYLHSRQNAASAHIQKDTGRPSYVPMLSIMFVYIYRSK